MAKKKNNLTLEEKLKNALVPVEEQPYQIPENWVWTRLGEVVVIYRGVSYKKNNVHSMKLDNDCLILRGGNIVEGGITIDSSDNVYIDKSLVKKHQFLQKYDVVIVSSTGSIKVIGRAGVSLDNYSDISFGAFLTLIRSNNYMNKRYISYFFQSDLYRLRIQSLANGININNIKNDYIKDVICPLPPIHEQQRIVERIESLFSKLDEAKEKTQMSLDSFENRKSAILYKAFSGELTQKWREENGIKFKDWDKIELRERCHINPKKISTKELNDNMDITFIPMASVSDILGEVSEPLVKKLGKYKKGYTNFSEGDILFAKITPCMENGKIAVVKELENNIGFGSTEFHIVRCNNNTYNRFIYHLLRWKKFREEAKAVMSGAVGQQRVPKSFLEEYKISFPSLEEQKEIVHILDTIFDKEQDIQELIDLIENIDLMKKSILARAFRGELGTNIPEEESAIELLKSL